MATESTKSTRKIGQTTTEASEALRQDRINQANVMAADRRSRRTRDDYATGHHAGEEQSVGFSSIMPAGDLEDRLLRLHQLAEDKRRITEEYEALRDEIAPLLKEPMAFLSYDGLKMAARPQTSDSMVFDVDLLKASVKPAVFRSVTKISVDREALKRAVTREQIPRSVLVAVAKVKSNKTSIRFYDTMSDEAHAAELD